MGPLVRGRRRAERTLGLGLSKLVGEASSQRQHASSRLVFDPSCDSLLITQDSFGLGEGTSKGLFQVTKEGADDAGVLRESGVLGVEVFDVDFLIRLERIELELSLLRGISRGGLRLDLGGVLGVQKGQRGIEFVLGRFGFDLVRRQNQVV